MREMQLVIPFKFPRLTEADFKRVIDKKFRKMKCREYEIVEQYASTKFFFPRLFRIDCGATVLMKDYVYDIYMWDAVAGEYDKVRYPIPSHIAKSLFQYTAKIKKLAR